MWVCGPEPVLREEVISAALQASDETVSLSAAEDKEADIWAHATQYPGDGIRLVVVREAQRLRRWEHLTLILGAWRELAMVRLLLVSDADDFPRQDGELAPHVRQVRDCSAGQAIRCSAPSGDALLDWLASRLPEGGRVTASRVLGLTGTDEPDLQEAAQAAARLRLLGSTQGSALQQATECVPGGFADTLVLSGVRAAMASAAEAGHSDIGAAIGLLDSRLGVLTTLYQAQQEKLPPAEVGRRGVGQFLQRRFSEVARGYPPGRVQRCREVLAFADSYWRSGASSGVLESVAAQW